MITEQPSAGARISGWSKARKYLPPIIAACCIFYTISGAFWIYRVHSNANHIYKPAENPITNSLSTNLEVCILKASAFRGSLDQTNMDIFIQAKISNLGSHRIMDWHLYLWLPNGEKIEGKLEREIPEIFALSFRGDAKVNTYPFSKSLFYIAGGKIKSNPEGYLIFNTDLPVKGQNSIIALTSVILAGVDETGQIYTSTNCPLTLSPE